MENRLQMELHQKNRLLSEVAAYYSSTFAKHGQTPRGVDWNGQESQVLRFEQLKKLIQGDEPFSVNDLGCGYGSLLEFLNVHYHDFAYFGFDISEDMVNAAKNYHSRVRKASFSLASQPTAVADYTMASGVFNVRPGWSNHEWFDYLRATLDDLHSFSQRGFAFNCLTTYSDADKMRDDLYYADPCILFDLCKRRFSRNVALLHDYGLYEFTILVRK